MLFWAGAALAPLAALLLLLGDSNGMLRIAAVLTLVSVVLIGLSVALRGSPDDVRRDLDGALADEIGALRAELRQEIAAAAHGPGQAVAGRLRQLQSTVEALRGEVAAGRPGPQQPAAHQSGPEWVTPRQSAQRDQGRSDDRSTGSRASGPTAGATAYRPPAGAATYRSPAETPGGRTGDRDDDERYGQPSPGGSRGAASAPVAGRGMVLPVADRSAASGWPGTAHPGWRESPRDDDGPDPGWVADRPDSGRAGPPPPRPRHGVVRHTETVHVTTRQTIVDQPGGDSGVHGRYEYGDGQVYGGGHTGGGPRSADAAGWPSREADAAPWSSREADSGRWPRETGEAWPAQERASGSWRRASEADLPPSHAGGAGWDRDATSPGEGRRGGAGWDREATGPGHHPRDDRGWSAPSTEPTTGGRRRRARAADDEEAAEGDYWLSLRTGDRWASARRDDRGDELRMGERRAAVRADATGAEFRLEDRWAAVRREGFDGSTDRGTTGAAGRVPDRAGGRGSSGVDRPAEPRGRLELPTAADDRPYVGSGHADRHGSDGRWPPAGQPWADQGREPVRLSRRDDERHYGQPPSGDMPRAGGARRAEPGFFDEGWR